MAGLETACRRCVVCTGLKERGSLFIEEGLTVVIRGDVTGIGQAKYVYYNDMLNVLSLVVRPSGNRTGRKEPPGRDHEATTSRPAVHSSQACWAIASWQIAGWTWGVQVISSADLADIGHGTWSA